MRYAVICIVLFTIFSACSTKEHVNRNALFQLHHTSHTHIGFTNTITDNDSLNILNYEYLYNGGGVAIVDINNDGLKDLFFTGNQVDNALYLNSGDFVFKDISESAGVTLPGTWCTGISVIDINQDGFDDLYISVGGPGNKSIYPNKLLINNGDLTFSEQAKDYGLDDPNESMQSIFFDYDRDGDLDMYLLTGGGFERSAITARPIMDRGQNRNTDHLYRNDYSEALGHPVYIDVSKEAGIQIEGFGLGVSVLDVNEDGWQDLYISNDYLSRDLLYINNQDGTFTDQSLSYFRHTSHFSMGNDIGDVNNDGYFDIISVDMLPEDPVRKKLMFGPNQYDRFYMAVNRNYGYQYMRNMLHLNQSGLAFSEIGQLAGIHQTDWSWAPLLADFDNDGFQDLFITNGFGKDITDLDFVKFRRDATSPFSKREEIEKLFMDSLRNRPSITVSNYLYKNKGDLTFQKQIREWGMDQPSISNGAAYGDLDNDGDLDLVVSNLDQEAFVYQNTTMERDSTTSNYLQIRLEGPSKNRDGIGAVIKVFIKGSVLSRTMNPSRGFLSSVDKEVHVGLGNRKADSVQVIWPDSQVSHIKEVPVNELVKVRYSGARGEGRTTQPSEGWFHEVNLFDQAHQETEFNDFRTQPLLLKGLSRQGPGLAVADVNGDQLEDMFIGGAYGQPAIMFIQNNKGDFSRTVLPTEPYEDLGAVFLDIDGDGDQDLYVVSGGSERYENHTNYQDRLYLNDGKGNFSLSSGLLPEMYTSTSTVVAADVDLDQDLDLFVGGRIIPGRYPETPRSYLLRNVGGRFEDATAEICPDLVNPGMVTSAVWTDFNGDSQMDLVVVGEAMRIGFYKNESGKLTDITDQTDLADSYGMWNSISTADLDNDGDMDLVAGNLGWNIPYEVGPEQPLEVYYADFDNNGAVDPIFTSFEEGVSSPVTSLDQLTQQIPGIKKHILYYRDFAGADTREILRMLGNEAEKKVCKVVSSSWIENLGNERFKRHDLPVEAQFAPVNGISHEDIDKDGLLDLILVGNSYNTEVVNGRYDASIGTVLLNKSGQFSPVDPQKTNFIVQGDSRGIVRIESAQNESLLVVAKNSDIPQTQIINTFHDLKRISPAADEQYAILHLENGDHRKVEFTRGSGYLSQGSSQLVLTSQINRVEFINSVGELTRDIKLN